MSLFRYPGKKTWWYEFHFAGQKVRESAKTRSKEIARRAENARRRQMEESYHGLKKRVAPKLFSVASEEWLAIKKPTISERTYAIEQANLKHLLPELGALLVTDIDGKRISAYQQQRLGQARRPRRSISKSAQCARSCVVTGFGLRSNPTCVCFPRGMISAAPSRKRKKRSF
jgi:hypothetical protein